MQQQWSLTDDPLEATVLDMLQYFGQPEYESTLSQAQELRFNRVVMVTVPRQPMQLHWP